MAELFRISESDIGENTSLKNTPAWDSLRHMELVVGIETMYGIQLEVDEIVAMISYPAIVEVLRNKGVE
jgi:acyl carrier protein